MLGTLLMRLIFYVLPSAIFLLFDSAAPTLSASVKQYNELALPARKGGFRGRPTWWKVAGFSTLNVLLGLALQFSIEFLFTKILRMSSVIRISMALPMPWRVVRDIGLGLCLREIIQYYAHRFILHPSRVSRYTAANEPWLQLSKWHQSWQHSVSVPYSFSANYDHPAAWAIWRWLPVFLPAVFFRFHLLTWYIYIALVSLDEAFTYSGYTGLPSFFIWRSIARMQGKHLISGGAGNYAPIGIMDWIHDTTVGEDIVDRAKSELMAGQNNRTVRSRSRSKNRNRAGRH
ncbi:hypothetical protein L228DRAFT_242794 [Xylona heveae TC161]|uniref:Fatty acid hydroxylase domain-containing protein n=1 Tax=Xylona heveae (strain CBS 132557 / TC161) TaxID=1328760 RepID=A0A165JK39_XYLHT|nr:hypothetical protein L228DRAFT_242794 [Xylona heveae TC161]KZF26335.1 hypothetical protein L228DRAFT_242794 [Xylona heveae TC161]